MCRQFFGSGPWDALEHHWIATYVDADMEADVQEIIGASLPLLTDVVTVCLSTPMHAFAGRSLADWIDPTRVSPWALTRLERQGGAALFTSHHWIWTECLRLTALTGYRMAVNPEQSVIASEHQRTLMLRLGASMAAA
jgi:hypothetical protein